MTKLLSPITAVFLALLALTGPAFATAVERVQTDPAVAGAMSDGGVAVINPSTGALSVQEIDPRCKPGGYLFESINTNTGFGYQQAKANVLQGMARAIPVPSSVNDCLKKIMDLIKMFSRFSFPPDFTAILNELLDEIKERLIAYACKQIWEALNRSELLASYNKLLNNYEQLNKCSGAAKLGDCQPMRDAADRLLSSLPSASTPSPPSLPPSLIPPDPPAPPGGGGGGGGPSPTPTCSTPPTYDELCVIVDSGCYDISSPICAGSFSP